MAIDEHEPLLSTTPQITNPSTPDHSNYQSNWSSNVDDIAAEVLPDIRSHSGRQGYGAIPETGQRVDFSSNITYTWSDMNVFAAEKQNKKKKAFWKRNGENERVQRKQIIRNVNGEARPGELLAVLGSSGAGKTTLLNALTFHSPPGVVVSGYRSLNGRPATAKDISSLIAYVHQDDLFIGTLTPREHLIFQALVRMNKHMTTAQRVKRVDEVIADLSLTKCQHTVIGIPGRLKGISGGEKKRLSFASEVLTDPPLMFCDEPTSGLDSFMAQNIVQTLKALTKKKKTVVCTIHQPSSELYSMFDKLLLMAEGRVAFLGTPEEAFNFFSDLGMPCPAKYNPADYFIQLLAIIPNREEDCKRNVETICDTFQKSPHGIRLALQAETDLQAHKKSNWDLDDIWTGSSLQRSTYKASWWRQFSAVLWRSWLSVKKEPFLVKVRLLQTLMVAILIGIIYFGQELNQDGVMNINGALFMILTNMTFQNVMAVINVFCSELPIFLRENKAGLYRTDVYFLSKTMAEFPIYTAVPVLFTVIVYYMIGLNPEISRFFIAVGIAVLVAHVATSFGYMISCGSRSVAMAVSIGPALIIPFMLFGGFFLNAGSVPVYFKWLSYLSWFRYGNEALLINQWSNVSYIACTRENSTCPGSGEIVLESLDFHASNFIIDVVSLVTLIIGFRLIGFLFLLSRTFRRQ